MPLSTSASLAARCRAVCSMYVLGMHSYKIRFLLPHLSSQKDIGLLSANDGRKDSEWERKTGVSGQQGMIGVGLSLPAGAELQNICRMGSNTGAAFKVKKLESWMAAKAISGDVMSGNLRALHAGKCRPCC